MKKKKPIKSAIFIEGGVHGREWISPATATWILNELVKGMQRNGNKKFNIK